MATTGNYYTVSESGYYEVNSNIMYYKPTNELEAVANPAWRWWKLWVPKTVKRTKYVVDYEVSGTRVVFLKKGERIDSESARWLEPKLLQSFKEGYL